GSAGRAVRAHGPPWHRPRLRAGQGRGRPRRAQLGPARRSGAGVELPRRGHDAGRLDEAWRGARARVGGGAGLMTAVVARGRRRARPSLAIIAAAAATVFASLLAGSLLSGRHAGSHHGKATAPLSQAHALIGYSNAIFPATEQAGRTIVAGIKPDIADFRQGRISAEVWTADMQTRRREFAAARATFAKARAK